MTLREDADKILGAGLLSVEPRAAIERVLVLQDETLYIDDTGIDLREVDRVLLVGAGKAAAPMADAVLRVLGNRVHAGTITTKYGHALPLPGIQVFEAGHPVPDEHGQAGARAALDLAREADGRDLLLCLLSGGASALWPAPVMGVSLSELGALTNGLLKVGATIGELNAVRKHLSCIAGGQLARVAVPARIVTLVVSDVVGSPLDVIASGPTVPDPTTYADALAILARYGVMVPPAVRAHLQAGAIGGRPETPKPGDPAFLSVSTHVIARNRDALDGAAREAERLGYHALVLTTRLEGEAREVARVVAGLGTGVREDALPISAPAALLLGGETTVTVRGPGRGGRNQEMALAAALALQGESRVLVACLGTDGTDGPTDAAGAIVDGETVNRGTAQGMDAWEHLHRNDAYPYLRATGDLLITGPTGTNVNDLVLVLVESTA